MYKKTIFFLCLISLAQVQASESAKKSAQQSSKVSAAKLLVGTGAVLAVAYGWLHQVTVEKPGVVQDLHDRIKGVRALSESGSVRYTDLLNKRAVQFGEPPAIETIQKPWIVAILWYTRV